MLMKPAEWTGRFSAAVLAAGAIAPDFATAAVIPLADPSFDGFVVPALGYAYANTYRPTSAWIDDLNSPPGYNQDDINSNWLYTSSYGESNIAHRRASPRTGNQAMHGLFHYSAQKTGAVFEAQMTYTFSLWAQGDIDATGSTSRVFLYLFDGSIPFSEANSLLFRRFAPDTGDFVNRPLAATAAQSQALWTQISLSHTVLPGAPEIGHPVGVAFWMADDGAVDDATLTVQPVPEPATAALAGIGGALLLIRRRRNAHGP
jgi:hypothetical protein